MNTLARCVLRYMVLNYVLYTLKCNLLAVSAHGLFTDVALLCYMRGA